MSPDSGRARALIKELLNLNRSENTRGLISVSPELKTTVPSH